MTVWTIKQKSDGLYGTYVTRAVVIAVNAKAASDILIRYLRRTRYELDPIVIQRDRLKTHELGTTTKKTGVVCVETATDNDEPDSWSELD